MIFNTPHLPLPAASQWKFMSLKKNKKLIQLDFFCLFFFRLLLAACDSSLSRSPSLSPQREAASQSASRGAVPAAVNQQAIIAFDDNVVSWQEQQLSLMRSAPSQSVSGPIQANTIAS